MITMGLGSPNQMVIAGLQHTPLIRCYMGATEVEHPLPPLFKDAYRKVVGERQKSHHKPAWKACRFAGKGWLMDRWLQPSDVLIDQIEVEYRGTEWRYWRQYAMTAWCELLTQAFKAIQDGNPDLAKELERKLKTEQESLYNRYGLEGHLALFDLHIDVENWKYSCGVALIKLP